MASSNKNNSSAFANMGVLGPISRSGTASPNPAGTIGGHRSSSQGQQQGQQGQHSQLSHETGSASIDRFNPYHLGSGAGGAGGAQSPAQTPGSGANTPAPGGHAHANALPAHFSHDVWRSLHSASPSFKSAREASGGGTSIWTAPTDSPALENGPPSSSSTQQQQQQQQQHAQLGTQNHYQQDGQTFLTPRLQLDDHSSPALRQGQDAAGQQQSDSRAARELDSESTPNALAYKANLPAGSPFLPPIGTRSASSGSMGDFTLSAEQAGLGILAGGGASTGTGAGAGMNGGGGGGASSANTSFDSVGSSNLFRQNSTGNVSGLPPLSLQTQQIAQRFASAGIVNSPMLSPAAASFVSASSAGISSPTVFNGPSSGNPQQQQQQQMMQGQRGYPFPAVASNQQQQQQQGHKPTASGSSLGSGVSNPTAAHAQMPQLNLPPPHEQQQQQQQQQRSQQVSAQGQSAGANRQGSLPPIMTASNNQGMGGGMNNSPRNSPSIGGPTGPGGAFGNGQSAGGNGSGNGSAGAGAGLPPFVHRSSGLRQGPHGPGSFSPQGPEPSSGNNALANFPGPQAETLSAFDSLARASPFVGEILHRLDRLEMSVRELHAKVDASFAVGGPRVGLGIDGPAAQAQANGDEVRMLRAQVASLSSSVAQFLTHQGQMQGNRGIVPSGLPANVQNRGGAGAGGGVAAHLPPIQQLAGLGLGTPGLPGDMSPNPALSIGAIAGTPIGDRAVSPLVGGPPPGAGGFVGNAQMLASLEANTSRLSPRPQGLGGGANAANRLSWHGAPSEGSATLSTARAPGSVSAKDERRWSGLGPGHPGSRFGGGPTTPQMLGSEDGRMGPANDLGPAGGALSQQGGGTAGGGGSAGTNLNSFAPVTKWEHLNLHPDLLRAIQKYGLGPPNKIQQRALPFLLRSCDIIAQAPPTQERIASYVIPALQLVLEAVNPAKGGAGVGAPAVRGPYVLIVSTTVDQATQAQRMALGLGSPLGVRVHMAAAGSIDAKQEAQMLLQASPHIVVGTPAKMCELWTFLGKQQQQQAIGLPGSGPAPGMGGAAVGAEVRFVVLDEVDQLIARNLSDYVAGMLRILPMTRAAAAAAAASGGNGAGSRGGQGGSPAVSPGFPGPGAVNVASSSSSSSSSSPLVDRQTAIFSNTVPQDVLNFAQSINLRETVRVLVRREGTAGAGTVQVGIGQGNGPMSASAGGGVGGVVGSGMGGSGIGGGGGGPGSTGPMSQPNFPGHSPAIGSMPGGYFGSHGGKGGAGGPAGGMGTPGTPAGGGPGDSTIAALRGLRQYYLWVPVSGDMVGPNGMGGPGPGAHGREMKLELIADMLEDMDFGHAVIYCGNAATMESVTYKLSSKGVEAMALHRDMNHHTRAQMMSKFRTSTSMFQNHNFGTPNMGGGPGGFNRGPGGHPRKALVVCDLAVNPKDVHQIPLVVFYDMPRSVDEYKDKVICAAAGGMARPGVCINVVTASGGPRADIEMLRTLECHLGCKMAELPMDPRQILNY
ncbi:hypothetical protein OC842_004050 [Tilletia horrida]|uniref:RNA helicase n=1 Tax=Tilletia horrida TaxID=155126 RepID=A0AAN6JQN6_9BASI|nr:hypothetical protein OC842_004050 [Tilletia horrida]